MDLKECLLVGFFCVLIPAQLSLSEHFEVSSPPSVIGNVDQDAILPCQISLQTELQNMEVKWLRIGNKHMDNIYQFTAVTGQEIFGPGYLGRIKLLKEGTATGNVSLKLKKVQVNDEGTYRCIVKSKFWISQTQTDLHVAALGNVSVEVLGPEGKGIKLACKSSGWFPEPELQWLAKNSQNPQFESKQDHKQLFNVWSNITVLADSGEITCSVRERSYSSIKQESTILLSRDIFPHTSPWLMAFWIFFILCLLLVGVLAFFICKGKQKQNKEKRDEEEKKTLLENNTKGLESENESLKRTLGQKEEVLRKCEEQKSKLEGEQEEFRRKLKEQESALEEKQRLIRTLESLVKTKEAESETLKRKLGQKEDVQRKCEEQKSKLEGELEYIQRKLKEQESALEEKQRLIQILEQKGQAYDSRDVQRQQYPQTCNSPKPSTDVQQSCKSYYSRY